MTNKLNVIKFDTRRKYVLYYADENGYRETLIFEDIRAFFAVTKILYRAKIPFKYEIVEAPYVHF